MREIARNPAATRRFARSRVRRGICVNSENACNTARFSGTRVFTRNLYTRVTSGRNQQDLVKTDSMNSTKVQNPRYKMQVALLAEPKTPLESSVFI